MCVLSIHYEIDTWSFKVLFDLVGSVISVIHIFLSLLLPLYNFQNLRKARLSTFFWFYEVD